MNTVVLFQIQSLTILGLIYLGVYLRAQRVKHVKIMATAITWDILLVLQIELTRGAIGKASKALINPMILNIHVSIAVSCVLLYFAMIYTGRKVLKGDNSIRPLHKKMGITVVVLRTLVFITSFYTVTN
jgi:hypothetical protein